MLKQLHDPTRAVEAQFLICEMREHLLQASRRTRIYLEVHLGPQPLLDFTKCHIPAAVVDHPPQPICAQVKQVDGVGREEDALPTMALGHGGQLALRQLLQCREMVRQVELRSDSLEDPKSVIFDSNAD